MRTVVISDGPEVFSEKSVYANFMEDTAVESVLIYYPENQCELGRDTRLFVLTGKLPMVGGGDGRKAKAND